MKNTKQRQYITKNSNQLAIKTLVLLLFIITIHIETQAQSLTPYRGKVEDAYNFWFYRPADDSTSKPIVIFLHGASLCGNNLDKVRNYGTIDAVEKGREIDAYILAPQNPGGSWSPEKIMRLLCWAESNNNIDTTRVYVLGMSLGGFGTMDFAATYPHIVAAAMAFCGGCTVKDFSALTNVPLWIVHGTADTRVSVRESDRVVNTLKESDGGAPRLHYDRIQGMNHSKPARIFYMRECYQWLFSHSLSDEGRPVTPKYEISDRTLQSRRVYEGTTRHKSVELIRDPQE